MPFDFDLFVIGAGSGGVRAARMSAGKGARVGIAEERDLGGTCVNVGCIPKKLFVYGSQYSSAAEDSAGFGWSYDELHFDWNQLRDNKTAEIQRLNRVYQGMLDDADVRIYRNHASLIDRNTIRIGDEQVTAEHVLIATGSWPFVPKIPGSEHVVTSNEVFYLDRLPERVVVVGGGYIAVEFAGIFKGLGADTTLVYRGPQFLKRFDEGIAEFVANEMHERGVNLRFSTEVTSVSCDSGVKSVALSTGDTLHADLVLYATGRTPLTDGLRLQEIGVETKPNGAVAVDDPFTSSVPNIYALGDVIDRVQLTPVAITEAMCLTETLFGDTAATMDYESIPTAVFCQPNIGAVGPTEQAARERYPQLQVFESAFRPLRHTLSNRHERTLMKLLVDGESDRVVGAHMVGEDAGEIIQGIGVAIKAGATKADFDATIGIHPTAAEEFVTMRQRAR